jgi:hypothetical protein
MGCKIYKNDKNELIHVKYGKLKYIQSTEIEDIETASITLSRWVELYRMRDRYFIFYKGKVQRVKLNCLFFDDVIADVYIDKKEKNEKCIKCSQDNFSFKCLKCKKNKKFKCPSCGGEARIRRQNTAYNKESDNYIIACGDCFEEIQGYWEERWDEYYSMTR